MVYRASALRGLAIAQMVFGSFMIILGIACVAAVDNWTSYVGFGIWFGVWVLVTGILGHQGAKDNSKPNNCLIGCFMGFSITGCIISGIMFICYCAALAHFSNVLNCRNTGGFDYESGSFHFNTYCYSSSYRHKAAVGAGLGSCQMILAIVEFFVALASSIYSCNTVCCGAPAIGTITTNQQVVFTRPQQAVYSNDENGVVIIQQSPAAMTTLPQGYTMPGQLSTMYIPPQPIQVHQQQVHQPAYWAMPYGSNPVQPGAPPMAPWAHPQVAMLEQQRPPPYSYTQAGNVPSSVPAPE